MAAGERLVTDAEVLREILQMPSWSATVSDRFSASMAISITGRAFETNIRLGGRKDGSGRRPAMSMVLDSSATLAWVYSDKATEPIRNVFNLVGENGAWVPGLWKLEVAHILEMGIKRGRHDAAFRNATLADLAFLSIHVDTETDRQAWGATLPLSERHRLTLYDAAYLELALRRRLPLASLDAELRRAAQAEGVVVVGS
jgi:predicted nucleic acid-binding protein